MRKLVLLALVGLAGAGAAVLPSLGSAQATTASFTAVDVQGPILPLHVWYVTGTTSSTLDIPAGGSVLFSYPSGVSLRNAVFSGPQQPVCTQTQAPSGYKILPAPPLPQMPQLAPWSGSCRFDAPGTYTFQDGPTAGGSDAVTGTINVGTTTATTTAPTTTTQTTGTTPGGGTISMNFGYPPFPAAASTLRAASAQAGTTVRAAVHVTTPESRLVADLRYGSPAVRLGRTTLFGVRNGTRHFSVHLYASAARLLRARHRLTITLRVQVLGQGLGPTYLSRHVTLTA